jgi:hypothetical protein
LFDYALYGAKVDPLEAILGGSIKALTLICLYFIATELTGQEALDINPFSAT